MAKPERLQQSIETSMSLPGLSPTDRPEARERVRTMATEYGQRLLADPGGMKWRQHAWLEPPVFQRLSELRVPTLILVGGPLMFEAPQAVEALSRAIPGARVVLMPAESTMINLDQPEAFNRIILDFLDGINHPPRQ
jgi:pimeloyl-ACP methyl ester carboxylesterase